MTRTIRKIIERHPLTKSLILKNPDQWAADSFTVKRNRVSRDPSVQACGLFGNSTGSRADIILCDDVEVPNSCDTAEKRLRLRERLAENEFILTPGGLMIYIGTPHSYYSIYAREPRREIGEEEAFLKGYKRLSLPLLKRNGDSNWPERYSAHEIERLRLATSPAKFSSQMMLTPVNSLDARLDLKLLRRYGHELDYREVQKNMVLKLGTHKIVSASAWWDPSSGKAKGGDASVLAIVYTDEAGAVYLHRVIYIKTDESDPEDQATQQCRIVAAAARDNYLPQITIESNGIGKFLPAILCNVLAEMRVPCSVAERSNSKAKDIRILEAFDTVMSATALLVHDSVYKTPFITEMQEWRPGLAGARDDGLDAAAGALSLQPVRLKRTTEALTRIWMPQGTAHSAKTDFDI